MSDRQDFWLQPYFIHAGGGPLDGQRVDWGLAELGLEDVHRSSGGEGVHVAICDTGWSNHPDLPAPLFVRNFTGDSSGEDGNGHGTHCAGIVGCRDNGIGGLGVAPRASLSSYKCLSNRGSGSSSGIAQAIRAAVDDGARIINLSLGGGYDRGTEEACEYAGRNGAFIVVAAGNAGRRGMDYPALLPSAFAVASTRRGGGISDFSSRGAEVDVACPGEAIYSTAPGNRFATMSGTSMACPFFCGVLALMLASQTDFAKAVTDARSLRELIAEYTHDAGRPGHDSEYGAGIPRVMDFVNAFRSNVAPGVGI